MSDVVKVPDFAGFKIDKKEFYKEGLEIIVREIVKGIETRKAITGGDLPRLEPETIMRKMHDHQLVDKGLLSDQYTYQRTNRYREDTGVLTIKARTAAAVSKATYKQSRASKGAERDMPRDEVGAKLQAGIIAKNKLKRFVFFGISKDGEAKIMELAGELIRKALEAL